ncbi:MAG: NTP transferase domain-containing protein [Candidatus Omnitrophica bacterium]|nr:NTP transferase domain-containing protein [Candidatus Omnitrophota bacterium]
MDKKIIAFIQSRMGSSRLPGKALLPIMGVPLILRVVERVECVNGLDDIVVLISNDRADDILAERLEQEGKKYFRGDLENVQKRFYDAMLVYQPDVIMRVTGDNPLIEPILMQRMVEVWQREKVDYVACAECILGVGAELFTKEAFHRAIVLSSTAYCKEHVTPAFYQNEAQFSIMRVGVEEYLADRTISLTVDNEDHYQRIVALYERFYRDGYISNKSVVAFLRQEMRTQHDDNMIEKLM